MKGLQALEREVSSAHRRLIKMRDAGRLGSTAQAMQYIKAMGERLSGALMYINVLKDFEVGRSADQDNIPT